MSRKAGNVEILGVFRDKQSAEIIAGLTAKVQEARAEVAKLQAFKDWVHAYLDGKGVPHHPPGPHGAEGCRIGDRMDWVFARLAAHPAAADAAEPAGWRPIESAPKDGTWIILHLPGVPDPVQPAFWDAKYFGHDFGWVQYAHRSEYEEVEGIPEHWQPLPAPPTAAGDAKECSRCGGHGAQAYYAATGGHGTCEVCGGSGAAAHPAAAADAAAEPVTHAEWTLLYQILNDRQNQAQDDGIHDDHPSSVFRLNLLDKLVKKMGETAKK